MIEISGNSTTEIIRDLKSLLQEGIYFIGFGQSHVGFILKRKEKLFLIHSNYLYSKGVEIEKIEASEVFQQFNNFCLAEISTNKTLLKNWLTNKKIEVVTN